VRVPLVTVDDLTADQREALRLAEEALQVSYNPHSHFAVGACLLMTGGEWVTGANVENAAYGPTICAERSAVVRANAEGFRTFAGIAVIGAGKDLSAEAAETVTGPCGVCRQVLYEMAEVGRNDPWVVIASPDKSNIVRDTVRGLLPYGFGPTNLGLNVTPWKR
jgi:cytidine deaminase